jgi:hypothetical protein
LSLVWQGTSCVSLGYTKQERHDLVIGYAIITVFFLMSRWISGKVSQMAAQKASPVASGPSLSHP